MSSESKPAPAMDAFEAALKAGRVAQAYLVIGDIRDEGLPFAVDALRRLLCEGLVKPCGACSACQRVEERTHPDVLWIEPEKVSRTVGIERIRDLQRTIYRTTLTGGWKAVVLAGADRLGEEAANAFLKTLEEPPPHSVFFLLTDSPQGVLPTILSRCQRIVLSTEQAGLPEPWHARLLEILALPCQDGVIGRVSSGILLSQLLDEMKKSVKQEEDARVEGEDVDDKTVDARIEARYRGLRSTLVRAMLFWHRDVLMTVCGINAELLRYPEHLQYIAAAANGLSYGAALRNVEVIEAMQRQFDRNLTQDTVLQAAVNALNGSGALHV